MAITHSGLMRTLVHDAPAGAVIGLLNWFILQMQVQPQSQSAARKQSSDSSRATASRAGTCSQLVHAPGSNAKHKPLSEHDQIVFSRGQGHLQQVLDPTAGLHDSSGNPIAACEALLAQVSSLSPFITQFEQEFFGAAAAMAA